jgi:hypothetical protein
VTRAGLVAIPIALAFAATLACNDPTHDEAVVALGPEPPGDHPGPTHRAGQPCLTCHGGSGPASSHFSIGGTVYAVQGQKDPMPGVLVTITDIDSSKRTVKSNSAGNFYLTVADWQPAAPLHVQIVCNSSKAPTQMGTHIGRDGSCADCHFDPPGRDSPGRVFVAVDPGDLPQGGCQ